MECKDVLVVADGDDGLQDEDARACGNSVLRPEICVLPENAVVLFMAADHIRHLDWMAGGVVVICVEVFDRP